MDEQRLYYVTFEAIMCQYCRKSGKKLRLKEMAGILLPAALTPEKKENLGRDEKGNILLDEPEISKARSGKRDLPPDLRKPYEHPDAIKNIRDHFNAVLIPLIPLHQRANAKKDLRTLIEGDDNIPPSQKGVFADSAKKKLHYYFADVFWYAMQQKCKSKKMADRRPPEPIPNFTGHEGQESQGMDPLAPTPHQETEPVSASAREKEENPWITNNYHISLYTKHEMSRRRKMRIIAGIAISIFLVLSALGAFYFFRPPPITDGTTYNIQNEANGLLLNCMTYAPPKHLDAVRLCTAVAGDPAQMFTAVASGSCWLFETPTPDVVLNVYDKSAYSGLVVNVYIATGEKTQQWQVERAGNGQYFIRSADNPKLYLTAESDGEYPVVLVSSYDEGNALQKWTFIQV